MILDQVKVDKRRNQYLKTHWKLNLNLKTQNKNKIMIPN